MNQNKRKKKVEMNRRPLFGPIAAHKWEAEAVMNPTAIKEGDTIHLIYRAVQYPNCSRLGYARIEDNKIRRDDKPLVMPTEFYEREGVEDPRLTRLDDCYYLLYTAWDGKNARVAFAESRNLKNFHKKGIVSPNIPAARAIDLVESDRYKRAWIKRPDILWDKDAALFPEKFKGKYAMLHRLEPDIQIVYFDDFTDLQQDKFWEEYLSKLEDMVVMQPKYQWEREKIGTCAVPIRTEAGWLLLYHGVDKKTVYRAGAALLDLKEPHKEISRLEKPLFEPEYPWEKIRGDISNVVFVFPDGAVVDGDELKVFYGCDSQIGAGTLSLKQLLKELS